MARRRLNRTKAAEAPPPAPEPKPEPETGIATKMPGPLADLFASWALPDNVDLSRGSDEDGPGLSRVGFYSGRESAERGQAILKDLGQVPEGTAYLYVDGAHVAYSGFRYVMLDQYAYWAVHDNKYAIVKAWEQDPGDAEAKKHGALYGATECFLTLGVTVPGKESLGDLAPAVVTLDTWRKALTRAVKDHLRAVAAAMKPTWAKQGANGALCSAPPPMRISSALSGTMKPNKTGTNSYIVASAFPKALEAAQVHALGAWGTDAECVEEFAQYQTEYHRRIGEIRAAM